MLKRWISRFVDWFFGPRPYPDRPAFADVAHVPPAHAVPPANREPAHAPTIADRFSRRNATARIIDAFDAAHPVRQRKNLYGRDDKLEALFEAVLFSRQHAIIHGARGSGKTSLAQVFGDYADQQSAVVLYTACEASANFADLLRPYLAFIPDTCVPLSEKAAFARDRRELPEHFGPREAVDFFSRLSPDTQIILILDEFDRVTDAEVERQVATLMKLLSDAQVPVQILIVGIARTLDELIACHPSLRRHLVSIPIGRISREDTFALIQQGAQRAGLRFDEDVQDQIATVACGSPYHVQLFCYVSAVAALSNAREEIDLPTLHHAMRRACDAWGRLNYEDFELFRQLSDGDADTVARIERAAREAAIHDSIHGDPETMALLGTALVPEDAGEERFVFRDSVAPQYLLALIALATARAQLARKPSTGGGEPLPIAV